MMVTDWMVINMMEKTGINRTNTIRIDRIRELKTIVRYVI